MVPGLFWSAVHLALTISAIRDAFPLGSVILIGALATFNVIFLGVGTSQAFNIFRARLPESSYAERVVTAFLLTLSVNCIGFYLWALGSAGYMMAKIMPGD